MVRYAMNQSRAGMLVSASFDLVMVKHVDFHMARQCQSRLKKTAELILSGGDNDDDKEEDWWLLSRPEATSSHVVKTDLFC
jgi:hypothetical protein